MAEPNTEPVEQWLQVWGAIEESVKTGHVGIALDSISEAVIKLYLLLEPPSVREAREKNDR